MYFKFLRWLYAVGERPGHAIYPIAGLYQCLWARYCGHDWRFALRMGMIYWWPKDREEAPYEACIQASDSMILSEARANGDDPEQIAREMRGRIELLMIEADRRAADQSSERP